MVTYLNLCFIWMFEFWRAFHYLSLLFILVVDVSMKMWLFGVERGGGGCFRGCVRVRCLYDPIPKILHRLLSIWFGSC